jgi:hypothetical protein
MMIFNCLKDKYFVLFTLVFLKTNVLCFWKPKEIGYHLLFSKKQNSLNSDLNFDVCETQINFANIDPNSLCSAANVEENRGQEKTGSVLKRENRKKKREKKNEKSDSFFIF